MKNVTFIIWAFVVLCAGCSSSTSVVQDEVSMTKKQLADNMGHRTKRFFQWSGKMGERF